jgi:hypothetical protein
MLRADGSATYEQGTGYWLRSGGVDGIEPVPEFIDRNIGVIKVAQVLGCPAAQLDQQPRGLVVAAMTLLAVEARKADQQAKAASKAGKKRGG